MIHRGEIVEQAVRKSGIPIATIAKRMGKSRRWMYLMFENPDVPVEVIIRIGRIISYDFRDELPMIQTTSDTSLEYTSKEDIEYWKNKYYTLLEEYNTLLKKIIPDIPE